MHEIPASIREGWNEVGLAELRRVWPDLVRQPYWRGDAMQLLHLRLYLSAVQMLAIVRRRSPRRLSKKELRGVKQARDEFLARAREGAEAIGLTAESRRRLLRDCPGAN